MLDTISTYRADGWQDSTIQLDYQRILGFARDHGLLPIRTEQAAVRAAERAYGFGQSGGPWIGQVVIARLGNWRWFAGFVGPERES